MQKNVPKIANVGSFSIFSVFPTTVSWKSTGFPRKCGRKNTKNADIGDFWHFFASYRPLVAKLFHILVEEVISFEMSGLTSKSVKN